MNESRHEVLDHLKDNHPTSDPDAGYKIAGFVEKVAFAKILHLTLETDP